MKLVDIKGNVTSKQRLVFLVTMLILIIVVFFVLKNINKKNEGIDYNNTNLSDFKINSSTINDRGIFWNLNEIVTNYINSYQAEYNKESKSFEDYYKALDPNYKKFTGKKKYLELSNNIVNKVLGENRDILTALPNPVITEVKKLDKFDSAYLCKLSTVNENDEAYIGIVLDTQNKRYNIFYIY